MALLNIKFSYIFCIAFFILVGLIEMSCGNSENDSTNHVNNAEAAIAPETVKYETFDQWEIPNGGNGKVIIINDSLNTIENLKKIGESLRYETRNGRNVFVVVFNNKKAAAMYHSASTLNDKDGKFYDKHFVAVYNRNINTGYNQLNITKDGLDGKSIEVKY